MPSCLLWAADPGSSCSYHDGSRVGCTQAAGCPRVSFSPQGSPKVMQCCQPESGRGAFMQALTELDCMPSPSLSSASSASGMRMEATRPASSALRLSAPPAHNPPGESQAAHSEANSSSAAGTWAQRDHKDSPGDGVEAKQPRRRQAWVLEKMRGARKSLDSSRWGRCWRGKAAAECSPVAL